MSDTRTWVKASELKLADTIQVECSAWNFAIVKQVTEQDVVLFRPYGVTEDFSYSGGAICYVGIEEYSIPRNDRLVRLLERRELK